MRYLKWLAVLIVVLVVGLVAFDYAAPATAARLGMNMERERAGLIEKSATVAGMTMPYLEGGSGQPLVLVHGFGADKDNYTRVSAFLTPRYHVIAPDLPGFGGASRDLNASYRIADQVERLHAFIAQLGLKRVHLGGSSMGGFIVTQYAATYPDEVASLWLLDSAGTLAGAQTAMIQTYLKTGEIPLLVKQASDYKTLWHTVMSKPPLLPHSVMLMLGDRAASDYALHSRILKEINVDSPMLETQYQTIAAPALIVWGREDRILSPGAAETQKKLLPNSQVVLMDGIGHLPMVEDPKAAATDYLKFRDGLK